MKEPVDSFGRRFKDMPGDNWSVDQGLPLTIEINGTVVPPSLGAFPDEAQEARASGNPTRAGFFAPTDPQTMFNNVVNRNLTLNFAHWTRCVPKRDYTIRSVGFFMTTAPPAVPYNIQIGVWEWDPATDDAVRVAWVTRLNKARTGANVYDLGVDVPFTAGVPYWIGIWCDKGGAQLNAAGILQAEQNSIFGPSGFIGIVALSKPHTIFMESFPGATAGGIGGINNLYGFLLPTPGGGGQVTLNGMLFALREEPGNLPV